MNAHPWTWGDTWVMAALVILLIAALAALAVGVNVIMDHLRGRR